MATIKEYYEKDFENYNIVDVSLEVGHELVYGGVVYDFVGNSCFLNLYIPSGKDFNFFFEVLNSLSGDVVNFNDVKNIRVHNGRLFLGQLSISNIPDNNFEFFAKFLGEEEWLSSKDIPNTRRLFIYSESNLTNEEIKNLKIKAKEIGLDAIFRADSYKIERSRMEKPYAFISHDSKDKELIARKVAVDLQTKLCPVWYDEFSLNVGDNLRTSIERGLKECKKCILVLSPSFLSNTGWTKTEFDSIFSRQLIMEQNLLLPIWYNVSKKEVYEYSPSLALVVGLDWNKLGEEEVCRQLYNAVMR